MQEWNGQKGKKGKNNAEPVRSEKSLKKGTRTREGTLGKRRDSMGLKQSELTMFGEEIKRTLKVFC